MAAFVHLRVTSCYSFLRGVPHPEGYLARAAELGLEALALTEDDYLCALVRFDAAAREAGIRGLLGGGVASVEGPVAFLCRTRAGYGELCRFVSRVHLAGERNKALAGRGELERLGGDGLLVLTGGRRGRLAELLRAGDDAGAEAWLRGWTERFGRRGVLVELQRLGCAGDERLTLQQVALAKRLGLRYVATNDVRYLQPEHFPVYDLMCCTRRLQPVDTPFVGRPVTDWQWLASEAIMRERFADLPEAIDATVDVAGECDDIPLSRERFIPRFNGVAPEEDPALLRRLVEDGVRERYPRELWRPVLARAREELRIIEALGLPGYFLLVWDVCRWARAQGIRCAGRGSAAGSVVCYVLRITNVDAFRRDITPARFLNEQRTDSLPDIDVDFDREGRDKVIDYVVARYGVEHVAMTGTYMRYHARSAVRDIGRALALPLEEIGALAKSLPHIECDAIDEAEVNYPDIRHSPWAAERFARLRRLVPLLAGVPRHLGTHNGGVIISPVPLAEVVGVQHAGKPFQVIHGDKEDVEDRLVKFDCLCLPMFGVIEDANRFIQRRQPSFEIFDVPLDDEATYARLRRSETWGAFEVGSPAQRSLHARLHCDCFEPLVAALALIRPGPIAADMVPEYLDRRHGRKPVEYWMPELEPVLQKTYGVLVYQEQVIEVARMVAGLSAAEADILRRSISHYRSREAMAKLGETFCAKATARGVDRATAEGVFTAVQAFAGYGFCESHAAAFADTAYRSVYLIEHYPGPYFAGLLRHQPMGFYPPHTLVAVAQRRGVEFGGPCVNTGPARTEADGSRVRIGLAQAKHVTVDTAERIVAMRPYDGVGDLMRRAELRRNQIASLIRAGACDGLSTHRRMLLWQLQELPPAHHEDPRAGRVAKPLGLPLMDPPADPRLPRFDIWDLIRGELETMGFSLVAHPIAMVRETLTRRGIRPVAEVPRAEPGTRFTVCGLVIRPHRPPTRHGRTTMFFDLEDETGIIPITCFRDVYQRDGHIALHNPVVTVSGRVDARVGQGLIADRLAAVRGLESLASPHARSLY